MRARAIRPHKGAAARKSRHHCPRRYHSYAMVVIVPHKHIAAAAIHRHPVRVVERGRARPKAIGKGRVAASASQGCYLGQGRDPANAVGLRVCHVQHTCRVNCKASGVEKARIRASAIRPSVCATARKNCGGACEGAEPDAAVAPIRAINAARGGMHRHASRRGKPGASPSAICKTGLSAARKSAHKASRRGHSNPVISQVCHEHHARSTHCQPSREVKICCRAIRKVRDHNGPRKEPTIVPHPAVVLPQVERPGTRRPRKGAANAKSCARIDAANEHHVTEG